MTTAPEEANVLEEHAEQAAFLWALRDAAAGEARYTLRELEALDDRLDAHLDSLRLAGDAGRRIVGEALDDLDAGTAFTAAVLAAESRDLRGVARVLDEVERHPVLGSGFKAALGWVPVEALTRILPGLLANRCPAGVRLLGIAGCALHRTDPGSALDFAVLSEDPRLRARALRAAGELGRVDLRRAIRDALPADEDEACRFAAAWTGALWGEPEAARVLSSLAERGGPLSEPACAMVVRSMPPSAARTWLHGLARSGAGTRASLAGAAALGDAAMVPWLIEHLAEPATARLAAAAMAMITGADLVDDKLTSEAPAGPPAEPMAGGDDEDGDDDDDDDDDGDADPDEDLPWPDAAAVEAWWGPRKSGFRSGQRYLMGRPIEPAWLEEVLRSSHQLARAAAAVELCLSGKHKVLFEVRAPGQRQRRRLGARG